MSDSIDSTSQSDRPKWIECALVLTVCDFRLSQGLADLVPNVFRDGEIIDTCGAHVTESGACVSYSYANYVSPPQACQGELQLGISQNVYIRATEFNLRDDNDFSILAITTEGQPVQTYSYGRGSGGPDGVLVGIGSAWSFVAQATCGNSLCTARGSTAFTVCAYTVESEAPTPPTSAPTFAPTTPTAAPSMAPSYSPTTSPTAFSNDDVFQFSILGLTVHGDAQNIGITVAVLLLACCCVGFCLFKTCSQDNTKSHLQDEVVVADF